MPTGVKRHLTDKDIRSRNLASVQKMKHVLEQIAERKSQGSAWGQIKLIAVLEDGYIRRWRVVDRTDVNDLEDFKAEQESP